MTRAIVAGWHTLPGHPRTLTSTGVRGGSQLTAEVERVPGGYVWRVVLWGARYSLDDTPSHHVLASGWRRLRRDAQAAAGAALCRRVDAARARQSDRVGAQ